MEQTNTATTTNGGNGYDAGSRGAMDIITAQNQEQSPLLSLPGEVRNEIYRYVLGGHRISLGQDECNRYAQTKPGIFQHRSPTVTSLLSFTATCSQIHAESALLFYSLNDFGYLQGDCSNAIDSFLDSLSNAQRKAIRKLWFGYCHFFCHTDMDMDRINEFPNLCQVTVCAAWRVPEEHKGQEDDPKEFAQEIQHHVVSAAGKDVHVVLDAD